MRTIIRQNYTPKVKDFCNTIIADPAHNVTYIFDQDGIWSEFEVSQVQWGKIIGSLENQEDLNKALTDLENEILEKTGALNTRVDNVVSDLDDERAARESEDIYLQKEINELGDELNAEKNARIQKDTQLETAINAKASQSDLQTEINARTQSDNNLQNQIDAISASSDVKDIVGTHAELESYDTSTLGENDIIKVLKDETHDNAATLYRWVNGAFVLIGSEGPYYTKGEADEKFVSELYTTIGENEDGPMTQKATTHMFYDANMNFKPQNSSTTNFMFGPGAYANNSGEAMAVFSGASATGSNAFAVGGGAGASGMNSVAFGPGWATKKYAHSFGPGNRAEGIYAFAIGSDSKATGDYSISIGNFLADSKNKVTNDGPRATAKGSIAIGTEANSTAESAVAIGFKAKAESQESFALGLNAHVDGTGGYEAIGRNSTAGSGGRAYAGATASSGGLAIGENAKCENGGMEAIGKGSYAKEGGRAYAGGSTSNGGTEAIGVGSVASSFSRAYAGGNASNSSVAFGGTASHINSVSLGSGSVTTETFQVSIGNADLPRKLSFLKAGEADTDAVNKKQLDDAVADYVKKTDYATTTVAGIICAGNWVTVNPTTHKLEAGELTKSQYDSAAGNTFIGKTTFENVITGKGLVSSQEATKLKVLTQAEYDALTPADDTIYFIKEA